MDEKSNNRNRLKSPQPTHRTWSWNYMNSRRRLIVVRSGRRKGDKRDRIWDIVRVVGCIGIGVWIPWRMAMLHTISTLFAFG
jgi:hypothetical protein